MSIQYKVIDIYKLNINSQLGAARKFYFLFLKNKYIHIRKKENGSNQYYEYRFGIRFDLSMGTENFDSDLFRCTVLDRFGITTLYIYIYIYIY